MLTRDELIALLSNEYGESTASLQGKDPKALNDLLQGHKKKHLLQICDYVSGHCEDSAAPGGRTRGPVSIDDYWQQIVRTVNDPMAIYGLIDEMIEYFSMAEIDLMLDKCTNEELYNKVYKKFRVKYRQYQEELLEDIESEYAILPEEERYNQMKALYAQKGDIDKLRSVLMTLHNPKQREMLERISHTKNRMQHDYYPDSYEKEFREYREMTVIRGELTAKVLKLTKRYSEDELKNMTPEELEALLAYYRDIRERAEKERKMLEKYVNVFIDLAYEPDQDDDRKFRQHIGSMFVELDNEKVLDIVNKVKAQSDTMGEKLYSAYLSYLNEQKT